MIEITAEYLAVQGLSVTFPNRFWEKVDKYSNPHGCWIWTGFKLKGYGRIQMGGRKRGVIYAPRASWILHFGPIPDGLYACHDCPGGDNPACIRPEHLWLGNHDDNQKDMAKKKRVRHGPGKPLLTWQQVCNLRSEIKDGRSRTELMQSYGISGTEFWRIKTFRIWLQPR